MSDCDSWSLAELVRASKLPKSTVHRLLSVLCDHELLWQDPQDERYRLGGLAARLGQRALAQRDLRQVAWSILNRLAEDIGETVILGILNAARDKAVYVEQIENPVSASVSSRRSGFNYRFMPERLPKSSWPTCQKRISIGCCPSRYIDSRGAPSTILLI